VVDLVAFLHAGYGHAPNWQSPAHEDQRIRLLSSPTFRLLNTRCGNDTVIQARTREATVPASKPAVAIGTAPALTFHRLVTDGTVLGKVRKTIAMGVGCR
jgi:hypothetical protein